VRRHPLAQMLVIGVLASVIGVILALLIDWFPVAASEQAKEIDTLYDVLLVVSVPVFVLVMTVVLYCVWNFRMRRGQEDQDGPPIHGHTGLEIIWTVIPAVLIFGLIAYAYVVLVDIEESKAGEEVTINVTGQQFAWTFEYPAVQGPDKKPLKTPQLYLEEGVPVVFKIRSRDVIHDFWVPAFRMKIDAVPGITTEYRVTPNRLGEYDIVCAELCGLGHSVMRSTAHVLSPGRYNGWRLRMRKPPTTAGGGDDPKQIFTQNCASCHTLADAGSSGTIGPDLDDVLKGMDEAKILESIVEPDAEIASGYSPGVMPGNFGQTLNEQQQKALVDYLAKVTQ
jgi:cytochrome c oxidase subunit II